MLRYVKSRDAYILGRRWVIYRVANCWFVTPMSRNEVDGPFRSIREALHNLRQREKALTQRVWYG